METATRGLVKYQGSQDTGSRNDSSSAYGDGWQQQVDMAASCLAAAALQGGMPRVAGTLSERQLARYMTNQAIKRRRTAQTKLAVILLGQAIAVAAGCYIGMLR